MDTAESRIVWAWDLETYLIAPGLVSPPVVSLAWACCPRSADYLPSVLSAIGRVLTADTTAGVLPDDGGPVYWGLERAGAGAREALTTAARDPRALLVGHNLPFDLDCARADWPDLTALLDSAVSEGRAADTLVRDQLIDIAAGQYRSREDIDPETGEVSYRAVGYTLAEVAGRRLGVTLAKGEDSWRLRYAELATVPVAAWPLEAARYAVLDALVTLGVYLSQLADWDPIPDEQPQTAAAVALARTAARGLCVDPVAVATLAESLSADVAAARKALGPDSPGRLYRADGTKDTAAVKARVTAAWESRGAPVPTTDKGAVKTDRQTLLDSGDPVLRQLAEIGQREKLLTSFVPVLQSGLAAPVVARYHPVMETGRTSCSNPNVQQLPRYPGVRDCFVPRAGYYLCSVDYDSLELRTLAQVCLDLVGYSTLADRLKADPEFDPHAHFAAEFLGVAYTAFVARLHSTDPETKAAAKAARQRAKAANFGFPGGLGVAKFREYARTTYGVTLGESEARELRAAWARAWPEVAEYQRLVSAECEAAGPDGAAFAQVRTGFVRGGCRYTQGCNQQFQGLAAAGAKRALIRAVAEGPAHGVYPVAFLHDEIIAEVEIDRAHSGAYWLADTMCRAMAELTPGVPISASPALMARWYKGAEPEHDPVTGTLVPWVPPPPTQSK